MATTLMSRACYCGGPNKSSRLFATAVTKLIRTCWTSSRQKSRAAKERESRHGEIRREESQARRDVDEMRPSTKVARYLHARQCRWSGIDHLFVEQMLEGKATQTNVGTLAPVLTELATKSAKRPGAPAAVATLCLQWLIVGYPVQSVRRIMKLLPDGTPSKALLELVCALFEAPVAEVPRRIAALVDCGKLPVLLAALIHRQRLLANPPEFRNLSTYRAARHRLAADRKQLEGDDEEARQHARDLIRRLEGAIENLSPAPPVALKDEVPQRKASTADEGQAMLALFASHERSAERLGQVKEEAFRLIKEKLDVAMQDLSTSDLFNVAAADRAAAEELVRDLGTRIDEGLKRFQELCNSLSSLPGLQLPADYAARSEEQTAKLQSLANLGKFAKSLKRIDGKIAVAAEKFSPASVPPSAEWSALLAALRSIVPEASVAAAEPKFSPSDRLEQLESAAKTLDGVRAEFSEFLRAAAEAPSESGLARLSSVDYAAADSLLKNLQSQGERGLAEADEIRASLATAEPAEVPENVDHRLEEAANRLRTAVNLGSLRRRLNRLNPTTDAVAAAPTDVLGDALQGFDKTLSLLWPAAGPEALTSQSQPEPQPEPTVASEAVVAPATSSPPPSPRARRPEPTSAKPRNEMTVYEQLALVVARVDWAVERIFDDALETFDAYPRWIRMTPYFETLQRQIQAARAETIYRLGRSRAAQKIWNGMLRSDRLNIYALNNIAVCYTIEGDVGRSLSAWREYLELLYLFDVCLDDPAEHAATRVQFHRAFGNAYAPAFLSAKFDNEWSKTVDAAALISFLSSPGRVRNYINHRLLEFLNTRFEFESPSLVLGIKRTEAEGRTDDAEKTMLEFVAKTESLIPPRAAKPFARLAEKTFRKKAVRCRDVRRLTLQESPKYDQEETRQVQVLARIFELKVKLVVAFNKNVDMVKNITSLDFLAELSRLDQVPLKVSPGLMPLVANSLQIDVELLHDLTSAIRENVILSLLKYLLADDDPSEDAVRRRQYGLLLGKWVREPEFRDFARLIDSPPRNFMAKQAADALAAGDGTAALDYLCRWNDAYPAMAGLAVQAAHILFKRREYAEARERLRKSYDAAIYEPTRRYINYLLVQIVMREIEPLLEAEKYDEALEGAIQMTNLDDFQAELVSQMLQLYVASSIKLRRRFREREVEGAVAGWIDRAEKLAKLPDENEQLPHPTVAQIEQVRNYLKDAKKKVASL